MSSTLTANKYLSKREVLMMDEILPSLPLRSRLILSMLMNLGMRGAELLAMKVKDVSLRDGHIFVPGKKRSRPRTFPIPEVLEKDLKAYLSGTIGEGERALFEISGSGLKKLWMRHRPVKKGIHALRHTFAITLYLKTRDIKLVQFCLGHRSINSTMVYVDLAYSLEVMSTILSKNLYDGVNSHAKA
jgi:integrase/recombinase XerC